MEDAALDACQKAIDYRFSNPDLLTLALTHASVAPTRVESNERLEFLGDAVLGLVVCHELHEHASEMLEGEMTKLKSLVVSGQTCSEIAEDLGIPEMMVLGKGMSGAGGVPSSVSAAVFESLIGAIYLDGGLDPARRFILEHVSPHIEAAMATGHQRNFKSMLQQVAQRRWGSPPVYQLLDEKGPDHSKCFEVAVRIDGVHFPSAWGMNKKEAEQEAARQALVKLGALEDEDDAAE